MKSSFLHRHPFIKNLLKRVVVTVVTWNTLVACLIGTVILLFGWTFASAVTEEPTTVMKHVFGTGTQELLSIKVNGTILGSAEETSPFSTFDGETPGYSVKEKLYAAADDPAIRGVILEINSPGGTIYGSRAIADGVKYYKEKTQQPVYAYIEGVGASGAYWAAVSTDKVIADYGSEVGSIGVLMGPFKYYDGVISEDGGLLGGGVITQNGIETVTLTAGKSKDVGNPYRRLTEEEIKTLQRSVNNEYDTFVNYVSERRGISAEDIRGNIGALTYDNKTAGELRLIDATGSRESAYSALAEAAQIQNDFQVIREEVPIDFVTTLFSGAQQPQAKKANACPLTSSLLMYHGSVADLCKTAE